MTEVALVVLRNLSVTLLQVLLDSRCKHFSCVTEVALVVLRNLSVMHLSMSSRRVGHLNYLAVPGVGIFELLFVPVTTNHFLGWGISI